MTFVPTPADREKVKTAAGMGLRQHEIATIMGMQPKTLRKHYAKELETGGMLANAEIAQSLFNKAKGNGPASVTAAIFWLKCRAGWTETVTLSVKDERQLGRLDVSNLDDATLEAIAEAEMAPPEDSEKMH